GGINTSLLVVQDAAAIDATSRRKNGLHCAWHTHLPARGTRSSLLRFQIAAEYFDGWAGQIDVVIRRGPFQEQVSAGQMSGNASLGSVAEDACHDDGTGPCPTGQCLARASFPDAHGDFLRVAQA